jgi:hypothetical protein
MVQVLLFSAIQGNGAGPIYVAQAQFSVADTGANEI